jgi:hypothetical protein
MKCRVRQSALDGKRLDALGLGLDERPAVHETCESYLNVSKQML